MTVRLPEELMARIEQAATAADLSVNRTIEALARAALDQGLRPTLTALPAQEPWRQADTMGIRPAIR
jgi:hypothetical protein